MKSGRSLALVFITIALILIHSNRADSAIITHDVAFKVGTNGSIIWFEIDDPSISGTLQVTNAPYPDTDALNAATVDISRDRLIYDDDTNLNDVQSYAINLAGLQLLQNGTTPVTTVSLGVWPGGGPSAAYSQAGGQVYYLAIGTENVRYLDFNSSGQITGYTSVGSLSGNGLTTSIDRGDIDFDASGNLWVTGYNSSGTARLWEFNSSTLELSNVVSTGNTYNGMVFDSSGQTMYAYDDATAQYGVVNTSTGGYQTVLATDSTRFADLGDLAQTMATILTVPEPTCLPITAIAGLIVFSRNYFLH